MPHVADTHQQVLLVIVGLLMLLSADRRRFHWVYVSWVKKVHHRMPCCYICLQHVVVAELPAPHSLLILCMLEFACLTCNIAGLKTSAHIPYLPRKHDTQMSMFTCRMHIRCKEHIVLLLFLVSEVAMQAMAWRIRLLTCIWMPSAILQDQHKWYFP